MASLIDVYPYRFCSENPEFLILKRAPEKKYAGQWRMVAGKSEECETAWQSGLRELKEETGVFPELYWSVPSVNQFYDFRDDIIHHIPVFAAEIDPGKSISVNEEHTDYKWIEISQVDALIEWPEKRRLMKLIDQILKNHQILDEWKIAL